MTMEQWTEQALKDGADAIWRCDTLEKASALHQKPLSLPNYVAGELRLPNYLVGHPKSASSPSPTFIDSFEPKTGALLCRLPRSQKDDVDEAIRHARAAFQTWSKTTRTERSRHLRRISELLQEHRELFAVWESIDQGKTLERARIEVDRAISNFSWVAHNIALNCTLLTPSGISQPTSSTSRRPRG
jgi:aminomuconate-semialdehyde dehydrogenase